MNNKTLATLNKANFICTLNVNMKHGPTITVDTANSHSGFCRILEDFNMINVSSYMCSNSTLQKITIVNEQGEDITQARYYDETRKIYYKLDKHACIIPDNLLHNINVGDSIEFIAKAYTDWVVHDDIILPEDMYVRVIAVLS